MPAITKPKIYRLGISTVTKPRHIFTRVLPYWSIMSTCRRRSAELLFSSSYRYLYSTDCTCQMIAVLLVVANDDSTIQEQRGDMTEAERERRRDQ